jgi:hypothetical protein
MGKMGSREGGKLGRLAREEVGSVFGTLDGLVTFPISKDREVSTESEVRNNFDKAGWDAPQSTKYHFCECILRGFFLFPFLLVERQLTFHCPPLVSFFRWAPPSIRQETIQRSSLPDGYGHLFWKGVLIWRGC